MMFLWGILIGVGAGAAGFYLGARYVGTNLAKLLAKFDGAQLAKLADQVSEERRRATG